MGTILVLFAFSSLGLLANNSAKTPVIWVASGLERIGKTDKPSKSNRIQLSAARGEYEPFQIGIQAPNGGLTNVNILVSDLSSQNNRVISKNNITLYREHYVRVRHPSTNHKGAKNVSLGPGWYPDGLIPFVHPETKANIPDAELDAVPFDLKAGNNQPIWVDVFVPRNASPGEYQGSFTVTSDQGVATGKILLKVWNFELPLKPSLNSAVGYWEEESKGAMVELLKHKLMPARVKPANQRELIDKWGLRSLRLPFWSEADANNCSMNPPPSVEDIRQAAAEHESDLFLYSRYADEIDDCANLIKPVKEWARRFHQAGISTVIAMTPTPALYDDGSGTGRSAVDIWVVLPKMYDEAPNRVSEVLRKKDKIWSYNALVQDNYSPKWQIDFEPINFRIQPGFINQSLGLTGILYWRADFWTKEPWKDVQTYSIEDDYYPGEGMLVYPGEQIGIEGVAPSMRLKWLREGVEDYEYIEILKRLGSKNSALKISQSVGRDWKNWTHNPNVLQSARQRLGEEIDKLARKKNKVISPQNSV